MISPSPAPLGSDPEVPNAPHLTREASARLSGLLPVSKCYLEYGAGGSTVLADRLQVPVSVSVESDASWLRAVRTRLGVDDDSATRILLHADIGPTGKWGRPATDEGWRGWHRYPLVGWQVCGVRGLQPDLILIDGRFRSACLYACLLFGQPGTPILFDDYPGRPYYHGVEAHVRPVKHWDRMTEFIVPDQVDRDAVWLALVEAATDSR